MNVRTLLDNFDLIADAPGGVPKLRELILQLAVRGKLVRQDPKDESAEILLKRMEIERARLQAERAARVLKEEYQLDSGKVLCDLPLSWRWVPLAVVFYPISPSGKKVKSRDVSGSGLHPVVDQGQSFIAGYVDDSTKVIKLPGPVVVFGDHTRAVKFVDFDFVPGADGTKILRPILIDERYFVTVLRSFSLDDRGYGRHYKVLMSQMFPLPPLPEQKRIVAKVDELMKRCDELESRQKDRAARHKTLVASCLNAVSDPKKPNPNFIIHNSSFNLLFSSPDSVAELRKTILQLAVQGRLVPQDPREESVALLIEKMKAEKKSKSGTSRGTKSDENLSIHSGDMPYVLPGGWQWVSLDECLHYSESGWSPHCEGARRVGNQWGVLKVSAVTWGEFNPEENKALPLSAVARPECEAKDGDFLITRANTLELVARSVLVRHPPPRLLLSDKIVRLAILDCVDRDFMNLVNNSDASRSYYAKHASGTSSSMRNVTRDCIHSLPIPLPPLGEQKRIVVRVNELMAMCDEMEAKLTQANEVAEKLATGV